ncbi:hypothetical protein I307_01526 [Cryptococcus deuterogattii 99/473]|uniref:Uncharacterized protein n=2 Tax=Cryptococcus deuterogattii TaxID=1859096 RepID=A0A0D0UZK7_9TREE|nr:hypothetical protein CNBG_4232 [Cryptococcus deuterogattii R265]KIR29617.1 hypothetical protein I309_01686 [Cryptococcus deuterogattii LA55]KIR34418.1 hypothetical protein I352_02664 [Cryptococcus deuterogattii MMRL2647]KIR39644.1 hypothetical protein I313_04670 [Cryptococcus deuterogattii Ram5]KIR73980.1 hypothetical protein I310_02658 [Cryptococcus deuterogattii CA1014]KIR93471.1 hypothetical protein I304_03140 [Cryptococcus deuterogattii CBS 10090]KIR99265.1 hypothetical protein L804_02
MSASNQSTNNPTDSQQSDQEWLAEHREWLDQTLASEHRDWTAEKRESLVNESISNTIKLTHEVYTELSAQNPDWTEEQLLSAVEQESAARTVSRLVDLLNRVSEQVSNTGQS